MGRPRTNSAHIYIRFHQAIDDALVQYAHEMRMTKATAAKWLITYAIAYTREQRRALQIETPVQPSDFCFDGTEDSYFPERGRTPAGKQIGKPMILTLDASTERYLQLYATQLGLTANHFRAALLVPFLEGRRTH